MNFLAFTPSYQTGTTVPTGTSSASTTFNPNTSESVVLTNFGTVVVFVRVSNGAVSATNKDYPVMPGSQVTITKNLDDAVVAYVSPDGTGSLHIILGRGL
jgi:hypothetical protein